MPLFRLCLGFALGVAIASATLTPMVKDVTGSATPYSPIGGWVTSSVFFVLLGVAAPGAPRAADATSRAIAVCE